MEHLTDKPLPAARQAFSDIRRSITFYFTFLPEARLRHKASMHGQEHGFLRRRIKKEKCPAFTPLEKVCPDKNKFIMGQTDEVEGRISLSAPLESLFLNGSAQTVRERNSLTGFTLIELLAVVLILGILAVLVSPQYFRAREKTLDKQAVTIIDLIRAAEKQHWMEVGYYFPNTSTAAIYSVNDVNGNLSLDLVDDGKWTYRFTGESPVGGSYVVELIRTPGWGFDRTWIYSTLTSGNATCMGNCP